MNAVLIFRTTYEPQMMFKEKKMTVRHWWRGGGGMFKPDRVLGGQLGLPRDFELH